MQKFLNTLLNLVKYTTVKNFQYLSLFIHFNWLKYSIIFEMTTMVGLFHR